MRILRAGVPAFAVVFLLAGCDHFGERFIETNVSFHSAREIMEERLVAMADNAMLHDMAMAEIHFVPHTTELNTLGEQRLERYARLLSDSGGTLSFQSSATDKEFNEARIASITRFLAESGIAQERIIAQVGLRKSKGMGAEEAIQVMERAFAPEQEGLTDLARGGGGFGVGG